MGLSSHKQVIDALIQDIASHKSLLVAFSGGVDSATVAALGHRALGSNALAGIALTETLAAHEHSEAAVVAAEIGIELIELQYSELEDPRFSQNNSDRCYYCQSMRFDTFRRAAESRGISTVASGTHVGDLGDDRPGLVAMDELGIYQPLRTHGLEKSDVRAIARLLGLSVWDKPATACLSSRVPHGLPVVAPVLRRIERAEAALVPFGFYQVRVRAHGSLARVVLDEEALERVLVDALLREKLASVVRAAGFAVVALDCVPYASEP